MISAKPKTTYASDIKQMIDILSNLSCKIDNLNERFDQIESIPTEVKVLKANLAQF